MPKSLQVSTVYWDYERLQHAFAKDDFETTQQYRERMAATPIDSKLRAAVISPHAYAYDPEQHVLSIPFLHVQRSEGWLQVPVYMFQDDLGLPVEYGLSVPAESEFGQLLSAGDSSGIKVPVSPQAAEAMRNKRVDCALVYRLVRGEDSSPLGETRKLQPGWDGGPEMYTWRYTYSEVVGLWLFDPEKKRPVIQKFPFEPSR